MSVKFCGFNLMPWPDLPDDFRQTERSVWVDIPNKLFNPERANQVYNEYIDQLEFADAMSFDGIGVNEYHQNAYGMMPSPNIIAAGHMAPVEQPGQIAQEILRVCGP